MRDGREHGIDLNINEVNRRVGWEEGIEDDGREGKSNVHLSHPPALSKRFHARLFFILLLGGILLEIGMAHCWT
jgi:hypothetical protein